MVPSRGGTFLNALPLVFWTTTSTTHKGRAVALAGDKPPSPPPQPPPPPAVTAASALPTVASAAASAEERFGHHAGCYGAPHRRLRCRQLQRSRRTPRWRMLGRGRHRPDVPLRGGCIRQRDNRCCVDRGGRPRAPAGAADLRERRRRGGLRLGRPLPNAAGRTIAPSFGSRPPHAAADAAVLHERRARGWPATWPPESPTTLGAQSRIPSLARGHALEADALAGPAAGGPPKGPTWRPLWCTRPPRSEPQPPPQRVHELSDVRRQPFVVRVDRCERSRLLLLFAKFLVALALVRMETAAFVTVCPAAALLAERDAVVPVVVVSVDVAAAAVVPAAVLMLSLLCPLTSSWLTMLLLRFLLLLFCRFCGC